MVGRGQTIHDTSPMYTILSMINHGDEACLDCTLGVVGAFDAMFEEEQQEHASRNFLNNHECVRETEELVKAGMCIDCDWSYDRELSDITPGSNPTCFVCGKFMDGAVQLAVEDDERANRVLWCLLCEEPSNILPE
ncbi:MAG: hypothetical protein MMC23_003998 [Stictis urceolatum]|nr:hypothetical protein [Stictis urceolata]